MTSLSIVAMRLRIRALPKQKKRRQNSSLKRREAERREAHHRAASKAMRRASFLLPPCGGPRPRGPHGAGALAFRRPTAASEVLGLGSAQAALPGTTGCKREDPLRHQCSEHLAVRHAPDGTMPKPPASAVYRYAHENRSRSALRSTLAKAMFPDLTDIPLHAIMVFIGKGRYSYGYETGSKAGPSAHFGPVRCHVSHRERGCLQSLFKGPQMARWRPLPEVRQPRRVRIKNPQVALAMRAMHR